MSGQHVGCTVLLGQKPGPRTFAHLINLELRTLESYYLDKQGINTSGNTWLASVKADVCSVSGAGTPEKVMFAFKKFVLIFGGVT